MKILFSLFVLATLTHCSASSISPSPAPKVPVSPSSLKEKATSCLCNKMWLPVCGKDGKTYGNSCEAKCADVDFTMGECSKKI